MPRRRVARRCAICDGPARLTIQTRQRPGMTWLCINPVCQDRYYRLVAKETDK